MRQNILHILSILFLLASCQQEEIPGESDNVGYLSLTGFELSNGIEEVPLTKAVDSQLNVEITSNDPSFHQIYEAGKVPDRIQLETGVYTVKAYTTNYTTETSAPSYCSKDTSVTVTAGEITAFHMTVPMYNIGVQITMPEGYEAWFKSFSLAIGEQKLTSTDETLYLLPKEDVSELDYTISVTNIDDETKTENKNLPLSKNKGGMYKITFALGSSEETPEASN